MVWLIGPGLGGSPTAMEVLDALTEARDGSAAVVVVDGPLGGGDQGVERIRGLGADTVLLNRSEAAALTGADARLTDRTDGATCQDLLDLASRTGAVVAAKGPALYRAKGTNRSRRTGPTGTPPSTERCARSCRTPTPRHRGRGSPRPAPRDPSARRVVLAPVPSAPLGRCGIASGSGGRMGGGGRRFAGDDAQPGLVQGLPSHDSDPGRLLP